MDQLTKSNMVTIKKNKTMQWLKELPESQQDNVTLLAMKNRHGVTATYKKQEDGHQLKRQESMLRAKVRRDMLEKRQV